MLNTLTGLAGASGVIIREKELLLEVQRRYVNLLSIAQVPHQLGDSAVPLVELPLPIRAAALFPLLAADVFGVTERATVRDVAVATACLNHFAHSVDDFTDNVGEVGAARLHGGLLVLSRGIAEFGKLNLGPSFWSRLDRYFQQASLAERSLWKFRGSIRPYESDDIHMMGLKSAILKSAALAFSCIGKRPQKLELVEDGFDAASTGVQLIDDLVDWREDLCNGDYTFPLSLLGAGGLAGSPERVGEAVWSNAVLGRVIRLSGEYLDVALERFTKAEAYELCRMVGELRQGLDAVLEACTGCSGNEERVAHGEVWLRTFVSPMMSH